MIVLMQSCSLQLEVGSQCKYFDTVKDPYVFYFLYIFETFTKAFIRGMNFFTVPK